VPNIELVIAIVRSGRTRAAVAEAAGVSRSALSGFLTGRERPSPLAMQRLADELGYKVDELFTDAPVEVAK
jgi:transcriptional regulator with XRE-family HTH domain